MVMAALTILFSVFLGVYLAEMARKPTDDNGAYLLLFLIGTLACGMCVVNKLDELIVRQQLLEQKCIQAGIAEMRAVTTEARFEFIEVSAPAEKSEP